MELSVAMSILLGLATVMVVMLQQHLTMVRMATQQAFLSHEAPKIGDLLGRILNQTDHYFVYESRASAAAGNPPVLTNGTAVRLFFKTATEGTMERMLSFETTASGPQLRFFVPKADGSLTSWLVSNQLAGTTFSADQGVLSVTLQGPDGEEITYSGGGR
jgi:hypothetical protein